MANTIKVTILGREYALRVREESETVTRELATFIDRRMTSFKQAHPEQSELTAAIITALAIAEDLYALRQERRQADVNIAELDDALTALSNRLTEAL